jgi:hypothetical protein
VATDEYDEDADDLIEDDDEGEDDDEDVDLELDDDLEIDALDVDEEDDTELEDDDEDVDEEEDEEVADEEAEESLDVLLAREQGDDDALVRLDDEPRDGLVAVTDPIAADEFTCTSCFLVKRRAQLADAKKMICLDCA